MQRLNKEYKLNFNDSFNIVYGSVDRINPQVIYISGRTWLLPLYDGEYDARIDLILNHFKKHIRNKILNSTLFSNKYICDFDINPLNLTDKKKTFMSFEVYVKQNNQPLIDLKSIKPDIINLLTNIVEDLVKDFRDNAFALTKSKQK